MVSDLPQTTIELLALELKGACSNLLSDSRQGLSSYMQISPWASVVTEMQT